MVKIPVNPYDGAFKGGKYFFVKESNNYYKCVGQELSGATLQQMANGTWKLAGLSGNSVSYLFNSNGYLTQITHPSSVNITLSYNSANRLTNIAHSCGTSLNLLYSGNSLVQVRNNRDTNLWMQYSYADISGAYNNLFTATRHVSSSSSDNQVFKYYYESLTNANGISQSVIARKTNPIGDQYLWRYQTNYSLMADGAWVVSGGITNYGTTLTRSTNTLNTQMSVDVTTDRFGSASCSTYIYDLIKVVPTNIIGPLPYQFEDRAYDNQNNLTERCFSLNGDEALFGSNYDTNHNVIGLYSSYNSGGTMYLDYSLTWTTNRLLSEISDSLNRGYQFQYGSHDLPIQILAIDENNYTRSLAKFSYNSEGLPLRYTNANNHVTAYTYSTTSDGKNVTVQPPLGSSKTIKFDHLWRPTQFTERDSSGNYRTTYFQTDFAGRPLTITNPSNQVTSFQYDKAGRLIRAEDPSGRFITNEWRLGKLVSQTIGKTGSSISANISLEYDPQMTMVSVKDPMNRYVETYELDDAGQVTNVTTLDGRSLDIYRGVQGKIYQIDRYKSNAQYENSISIGYNTKGKVSSVSYPNHDSQVPYYDHHTYSYGYLSNGLLSSIVGDNNTIGLSYDSWNNLVQVRNDMENEWFSATNSFSYDAEGNLTNKVLTFTDYIDNYPLVEATYLYD
ncbi:MAG: RHS repeat protein, partial [Verrucomicrobia bacterium]|nr:RHS repeat protein [Verrucomicrobiota bacterium]